ARAIEREDLISNPQFSGREARRRNRNALNHEIESALQRMSAAEWESILNSVGIPAGRVLTVAQALANEQVRHRRLLQTLHDFPARGQSITVTRAGFKIRGADPEVSAPPPRLGEH